MTIGDGRHPVAGIGACGTSVLNPAGSGCGAIADPSNPTPPFPEALPMQIPMACRVAMGRRGKSA